MINDCKADLIAMCNGIADDLSHPRDVLEDDPTIIMDDDSNYTWDDDEDCWRDADGEEVAHITQSGADYITDTLDIEYTMAADGAYLGADILVTFGGPNIRIDTRRRCVIGVWGSDLIERTYSDKIGLDDAAEEYFSMMRGA